MPTLGTYSIPFKLEAGELWWWSWTLISRLGVGFIWRLI